MATRPAFASPAAPSAPAVARSENRRPWLDQVDIGYGPADLLGRFFLAADTALRERGVTLSFATFDELMAANRANSDTWRPILSIFDPAVSDISPEASLALIGRNAAGEIVATQAARLYDWTQSNLKIESESLRIFYRDPETQKRPGERCVVTAPAAETIFGRCVYSGAVWFRPDYRKRWLTGILPRISRALAYTRWSSDLTCTFMHERIIAGGTAARVGYKNVDYAVTLHNAPIADYYPFGLLWIRTDEMLADIEQFFALPDAKVDPVVFQRTA